MISKCVKFLIGVLLLPVCAAVTQTVLSLVQSLAPEAGVLLPPSGMALIGGFLLWQLLYLILPRPARSYVLAHELTHALWGWLMGARIMDIKVRKETGSVTLSKSNFLVSLAPYFFPFYTVLVIAAYGVLSFFTDVQVYEFWWLALVGLTWGFHVTCTLHSLLQRQSDIRDNGHLFSYALIYLMNVLGVALWIVLVSSATPAELAGFFWPHFLQATAWSWTWLIRLADRAGSAQ